MKAKKLEQGMDYEKRKMYWFDRPMDIAVEENKTTVRWTGLFCIIRSGMGIGLISAKNICLRECRKTG